MDTALKVPGEIKHLGWVGLATGQSRYMIYWSYESEDGQSFGMAHEYTPRDEANGMTPEKLEAELVAILNDRAAEFPLTS